MSRVPRRILAGLVALVVVWAFLDVGQRAWFRRAAAATRPTELTVLHWGDPSEDKIVAGLTDRFTREHPDVRIVRINAGNDFANKLKTMMAAGNPPDVFYLRPDLLPQLADDKLIAPLDEFFDAEPQALRDDYWPILLDALRYDPAAGTLGRGPLYALPKDFTTTGFYVNCDLFDRAGVDWRAVQNDGWTWDEFATAMGKIRSLNGRPDFAGRDVYGTLLQLWPDTLRNVLWTYGGDFFERTPDGTPDFARLDLDGDGSQRALKFIRRLRLDDKTAFNATGIAKDGGQEFKIGNIGCMGPVGQWFVPQLKDVTAFRWDVVPVPRGTTRAGPIFYTGWTMSSQTKHRQAAYDLIRFLCGREGQVQQARAGLAVPALKSVAFSDDFLRPPGIPPHHGRVFLDAAAFARLGPLPKQTEFNTIVGDTVNLAIAAGSLTTEQAAARTQAEWTAELTKPLRVRQWPRVPWAWVLGVGGGAGLAAVAVLVVRARREPLGPLDRAVERSGFALVSPWLIGFGVLTLGPMLASLLLAFTQWNGMTPVADARFVGWANFRQLLTGDPLFYQSLKVTAYFVIVGVPLGQVTALLVAMLMNAGVRGIAIFRTIYFVPSVISGAALAVLWLQLFHNDYGVINALLRPLATLLGTRPPNWFGYDQTTLPPALDAARWAVPGFVIMGLWGVGGGMIIYLAGLKGISASLYEAARIDGAGPLRQAWNVTLPMLSPLIFYNLVMGVIGSFQVFTQAYVMTSGGPENTSLFYVLNLYRQAFEFHNMGYASAMAWVLFVVVLVLTLLVFRGARRLVYYEGLR